MRERSIVVLAAFVLSWLLAACGGGSATLPPEDGSDNSTPVPSGQDQESLSDWVEDTQLDSQPVLYRGIPSVPLDGEQSTSQASDGDEFSVLGKDALDYSQCEVSGDAMIINPDGAAASNPDEIPAWALYRVSGLADVEPLSLNIECLPAGYGHQYSVAVADYTTLEWLWFGPVSFPELEADLSTQGHRFVTRLGNLYFLVVCAGENTATHSRSTVVVESGGGTSLPGAPAQLVASKGEFADGVALTWLAGEGAEYYEVWRKGADIFGPYPGGDLNLPPGDPGSDPPDPDTWELLATSEATEYFDVSAVPGYVYMYKARAVNEVGMSAFSNVDEGWAYYEIPPQLEGIHGYVYGSDWRINGDGDPGIVPPGDPDGGDPGWNCPELIPLAGAAVTIALAEYNDGTIGTPIATAITNEDGFYQFLGIEPGAYTITAELTDWFFPEVYWFEVLVVDESMQFDFIGFPDDTKPWDPPEGIHGWVWGGDVFPFGGIWPDPQPGLEPLADVRITFSGLETDQVELEVYTDEEGFYQVTEIAAGSYIVTAYLEDWSFEPPMHLIEVGDEVPSICLNFYGYKGGIPDPPDPEPPAAGIYGMAWGDYNDTLPAFMPLPGVTIYLSGYPEEILLGTAVTDEGGTFAFADLDPGSYLVSAELEGWYFQPPDYIIELTEAAPYATVDFWGYESAPGLR